MAGVSETTTTAELVSSICDALVTAGKIRTTPAFIRTDREAQILKVFDKAGLDGKKLLSMSTAREVDTSIRNVTQGEPWVDDVIEATKAFLPEAVASVTTDAPESEEVKKAKQAMREKSAARIEEYRPEDDIPGERGGGGGYGRRDQDNAAFASFNRSGSGGNRACYNCGEEGHQARECPHPQRDGYRGGGGGGGPCYNCGQEGHQARECPEPRRDRDGYGGGY